MVESFMAMLSLVDCNSELVSPAWDDALEKAIRISRLPSKVMRARRTTYSDGFFRGAAPRRTDEFTVAVH
jgi:hypothetical protein